MLNFNKHYYKEVIKIIDKSLKVQDDKISREYFDVYKFNFKDDDYRFLKCMNGERILLFLNWFSYDRRLDSQQILITKYNSSKILSRSTNIDYFYKYNEIKSSMNKGINRNHRQHLYRKVRHKNTSKQKLSRNEIDEIRYDYPLSSLSLKQARFYTEGKFNDDYGYKYRNLSKSWKKNYKVNRQYKKHMR